MLDKLLPCPFCNAQAIHQDGEFGGFIYCNHLFTCPLDGSEKLSASVNEWNTRAQPASCEPKPVAIVKKWRVDPWYPNPGEHYSVEMLRDIPDKTLLFTHPAPAEVVLPVRAVAFENRLQEWHTNGWNACLDEVARLNK